MDELVHHCLRQLSFDGDLGSDVSRLRHFVASFDPSQNQLLDDAFFAFVWSTIVQQPSVCIGTLPPGSVSEVFIAPQLSAKRKAAAKGEEPGPAIPPSHPIQLIVDAPRRSLDDLEREYGDNLRIAVDPETSFAAITGSHIRSPKLSPMVYSALQLITRGREDGITTVELGRKTSYDQKTCFYLVKQLVELGLVVKARRGGIGNHTCIHKYFVERSPLWQQIQEEARGGDTIPHDEHAKSFDIAGEAGDVPSQIVFDSIDSRHLSSLPLIKNRIVKLLRGSRNRIHPSNNLLMTIGFVNPTKTDRRFFQTRLRELIQQGLIERVLVPSSKMRDRMIKCIRLVTSDNQLPVGSVIVGQDVDEDDKDASLPEGPAVGQCDVKANLTVHKQVSNMLEEAGPSGLTLNEICVSLGNFDKRTIELLLTRASNNKPPAHLSDLGTVDLMETHGRERRHRYFTLAAYKCVIETEQLQDTTTPIVDVDLSRVGDFAAFDPKQFYASTENLHSYQDLFKDTTTARGKKRQRDEGIIGEENEPLPKLKRGRPRKTPVMDTTATPPKKRGRPRKSIITKNEEYQSTPSGQYTSKRTAKNFLASRDIASLGAVSRKVRIEQNNTLQVRQPVGSVAELPAGALLTNGSPKRHVGSESGDVQSSHSIVISRHASKCAGPTALDEDYHSGTSSKDAGPPAPCDPQALKSDALREKLSVSVAQKDETIATTSTAGQDLSPTATRGRGTGVKRKDNIPALSLRPAKRSRTHGGIRSRSNINISSLRRENELLKVIENMGGIANMHSKDIFDAHTALLNVMSQANEPTSAPVGTRLDKRTAESAFNSLESRGRIKMLKTSLIIPSGVSRSACLVYVPETPQEEINAFLCQLTTQNVPSTTTEPVKILEEPVEYGPTVSPGHHVSRKSSWDLEYCMTWHQKQYLAMKMDMNTGKTPLNAEDVDTQLEQISYVTSTPRHATVRYFSIFGEKLNRELENVQQRIKRSRKTEEAQSIEAKSTLRQKAEIARAQRERDWEDILCRIHPEPLKGSLAVRMQAVKNRFMQSTVAKDPAHWENEIERVIKETQLVSKKIISQPRAKSNIETHGPATGPPPVVLNPPEKSVKSLIAQQGPLIPEPASVKRQRKTKEESEASRRPRFHWTRDFDELARDASAIIRARCRTSKLDLSAFDQVFPSVPRSSIRQRLMHLRDNAAEDVYMKRLEDQWYILWLQYRGTLHLTDEDPGSPSNFNLISHVEFLRKHVDKNALRVGFVQCSAPSKLTTSVKELHGFYEVEEDAVSAPTWDFMWGTTVEEGREKQFRNQAFTKEPDNIYECAKDKKVQLAETVLKMVFGAPSELYDPEVASRLLHGVGDQCVSIARSNLLLQGVLSKLVRDPKKARPGRMLKISDVNLSSLGGPFPRDLFQDATSLEDVAVEGVVDEMEWPLMASEGDTATLFQFVSEDQVDFIVDLSQSRAARQKIDWNSKRADDEDIETSIRLRFTSTPVLSPGGNQDQCAESPAQVAELDSNALGQEAHGMTVDREAAACSLKTDTGLINCSACTNTAFATFAMNLDKHDHDLARRILGCVRRAREAGIDKIACLELEAERKKHALLLAHKMTLTSPPIMHWMCFDVPTLLAGDYCGAYGVAVSDVPLTVVTPRRWLDLRGYKLDSTWGAAQQAIISIIFLHPGISLAELRWRLRAVYDRQEIVDLASSLQEDGALECRTDSSVDTMQNLPGWIKAVDDDGSIFWFIAKNHHWYQI